MHKLEDAQEKMYLHANIANPFFSSFIENCVEFQKLNLSNCSQVSLQNATSPVMEFWE